MPSGFGQNMEQVLDNTNVMDEHILNMEDETRVKPDTPTEIPWLVESANRLFLLKPRATGMVHRTGIKEVRG